MKTLFFALVVFSGIYLLEKEQVIDISGVFSGKDAVSKEEIGDALAGLDDALGGAMTDVNSGKVKDSGA